MRAYLSTFASGMQEFIQEVLKLKLKNTEIVKVLDGAILYKTTSNFNAIKELRFFNNSFLVLQDFKDQSLEEMASKVLLEKEIDSKIKEALDYSEFGKTFRLIFSNENQLTSMDQNIVEKLEFKISRFRLKVDRSAPQVEFWFLKRREDIGFFMIRLTKHRAYDKTLQKGELRPEISNVAVLLSEFNVKDVVLDPFFGHGSLIMERSRYPFYKMIAIDNDPKKVFDMRQKLKGKNVKIEKSDSLDMERLSEESVDKIITDPPWGLFKKVDLGTFYERMIKQFSRLLRHNGIIILLSAQKELVEKIVSRYKQLKIEKRYDVLISGQKAAIYKIRKC